MAENMQVENIEDVSTQENKKSTLASLRVQVDNGVIRKMLIIENSLGLEGTKSEKQSKIVENAINHYFANVIVPKLQNL